MDIIEFAKRQDTVIFIVVVVLALFIGHRLIYRYNLNKIDDLRAQIEEEGQKNEILKDIGIIDKKLQEHRQRSLATKEITSLLDRISELAKEGQISIKSFNPLPAKQQGQYLELSLTIPLACSYHQLGRFLSLLESNQEFIWVKAVRMQKATVTEPGKTTVPKIDLTLSGVYLYD